MTYLLPKCAALAVVVCLSLAAPARSPGQARSLEDLLDAASAAQQSGQYAEAANFFRQATVLAPNTPELWSNCGVMEYLSNQLDASSLSLEHALRLNHKLVAPLLFLGKIDVASGKPALALTYLVRAQAIHPDDPEVLLTEGKAYDLLKQPHEAVAEYSAAVKISPDNVAAWLALGSASLAVVSEDGGVLASSGPKQTWARSLYADELLAQARPLEAVDVYEAAIAAASAEEKEVLLRNLDLMQAKPNQFSLSPQSRAAVVKLAEQLRMALSDANAPCAKGRTVNVEAACSYWSGEYATSAREAALALQKQPKNEEELYWSVKANERVAVTALSRVDELAPQSATVHVMVGDLYRNRREPDSARAEYAKALAIEPDNPEALLGIAASYFAGGKLDEAQASANVALKDRPSDPQLNLLMAEIFDAEGEENHARPFLTHCTNMSPEFQTRVHYLLGRAATEDDDVPTAIHEFELAAPGDIDGKTHYQLSRLYRRLGKMDKAQKAEADAKALIAQRDAKAAVVVREATAPDSR